MKLNGYKCHLINFGKSNNDITLKIDNTKIKPSKEKNLLGIIIDNNLSFKGHVQSICKKAISGVTFSPSFIAIPISRYRLCCVKSGLC